MVKWPWVLWWELGFSAGPIALIVHVWQDKHLIKLGYKLDAVAIAWVIFFALNVIFSEFPNQAGWYAWVAICVIAILYTLTQWLTHPTQIYQLLRLQGILVISFAVLSLFLWSVQTALPYLNTIERLESYGILRSFDWQIISLRNWYPLGHQNYVAGYLILSLPLLLALSVVHRKQQRFFFVAGSLVCLGCLYTTASRGSLIGLCTSMLTFSAVSAWRYPNARKQLGFTTTGCLFFFSVWVLSSNRLRSLLFSMFNSENKEIAYRSITNTTGWLIGLDHMPFGAGLGSVTLLYQKYRPYWAGQSAELTYQLHSTPAQLWAEIGLTGSLLVLGSLLAISYWSFQWFQFAKYTPRKFMLVASLCSGLLGYCAFSFTDYQLDNVCISGTIAIFLAILIFTFKEDLGDQHHSIRINHKGILAIGIIPLLLIVFWLYPIHRAWMISAQGFSSLEQKDVQSFVNKLEKAHELSPWEPYYPYQLGWNLGELAYQAEDLQDKKNLQLLSSQWFEIAIDRSPYREFGYSNLGWLWVNSHPMKAVAAFSQAVQLTQWKEGVWFALGYSLLRTNQPDLAIQSMVLELLINPTFIASPIWQSDELNAIYPQVLSGLSAACTSFIDDVNTQYIDAYFYQIRGALRWWQGDFAMAEADFEYAPNALNDAILSLSKNVLPTDFINGKKLPEKAAIEAWMNPATRENLIYRGLLLSSPEDALYSDDYLTQLSSKIVSSANRANSFHQWVTEVAPPHQYRHQRLGFGVLSRHIDGPLPSDFSPRIENMLVTHFFKALFSSDTYDPAISIVLEPIRENLIKQILGY